MSLVTGLIFFCPDLLVTGCYKSMRKNCNGNNHVNVKPGLAFALFGADGKKGVKEGGYV